MSDTRRYTNAKGRPVVAVTGMGLLTSLGRNKDETWTAMIAGRSGIRRITRFPTGGLRTTIAGTVDFMGVEPYSAYDLSLAMALAVAREAKQQARLPSAASIPGRLFIATPPAELEWPHLRALDAGCPQAERAAYTHLLAAARTGRHRALARHATFLAIPDALQEELGTLGSPVTICTACASGATAIQLGAEAIRRGDMEAALCVGTDATVHPEGLIRFSLLSALSTRNEFPEKASRPFSRGRDGFVVAEGAAALILESLAHAEARGAPVLGVVRGAGEKADDYHRTRSRPDGHAIISAMRGALDDAGFSPEQIDYVNAHGTSTPENDKMECLGLRAVFGDRLPRLPVSSNKSMIGHTLIAAGAVEAVITILTLRAGVLPPTINYEEPDPDLALDVVPNVARPASVKTALSNSFGFGGQNVCLVLSRDP
ncbi:MAG: beta-ketoacyl-ACP synthase [Hyphomicrobiales bacterium]|nr:MAG: beta-ketoacyl-ACP synthase [Hyphomicrobiales bacterium]